MNVVPIQWRIIRAATIYECLLATFGLQICVFQYLALQFDTVGFIYSTCRDDNEFSAIKCFFKAAKHDEAVSSIHEEVFIILHIEKVSDICFSSRSGDDMCSLDSILQDPVADDRFPEHVIFLNFDFV